MRLRDLFRRRPPGPLTREITQRGGVFYPPGTQTRLLGAAERRTIESLPWDVGGTARRGVTAEQALRLVPVYASWRLLGDLISTLPLQGYRRVDGDRRQKMASAPALLQNPSVHGTTRDWVHRAVVSLASRGNAYGWVTARDGFGFPTMLEWWHPDDVHVADTMPSGPGSYADPTWYWRGRVVHQGPADPLRGNLFHVPWFTVAGKVCGLSPLGAFAATVNLGLAAQEYSQGWFDAGGVPPGTMKNSERVLTEAQADEITDRVVSRIRRRVPLVYGSDWDYAAIAVTPEQAQFVEAIKLGASQVAAIYGIPPELVGGETGRSMTYTNAEWQAINLVQLTLRPWLELLEAAIARLLPARQYARFNADAVVRADLRTRHEVYEVDRRIGLRSLDELRALEDLEPLPDGQGQGFLPAPPAAPPPANRLHLPGGD